MSSLCYYTVHVGLVFDYGSCLQNLFILGSSYCYTFATSCPQECHRPGNISSRFLGSFWSASVRFQLPQATLRAWVDGSWRINQQMDWECDTSSNQSNGIEWCQKSWGYCNVWWKIWGTGLHFLENYMFFSSFLITFCDFEKHYEKIAWVMFLLKFYFTNHNCRKPGSSWCISSNEYTIRFTIIIVVVIIVIAIIINNNEALSHLSRFEFVISTSSFNTFFFSSTHHPSKTSIPYYIPGLYWSPLSLIRWTCNNWVDCFVLFACANHLRWHFTIFYLYTHFSILPCVNILSCASP